ncbi:mitochondrial ribosomal protein S6 [Oratosquilla oratoria]|uniref:mitochondrial ribosomal protein S6 n=1 Tax=Oratosquilla oratoria TaxID=337810 RepID=UPI003F76955C
MPLYEMPLVVKSLPKAGLVSVVKRVAEMVMEHGGYVSKVENLGSRDLPYRMKAHGQMHTKGSYFLMHFHASPDCIESVNENCQRDVDLIRKNIFKVEHPPEFECTLHEESLPPAYRKEVHKMMEEAKKSVPINIKKKFKVEYYPFN